MAPADGPGAGRVDGGAAGARGRAAHAATTVRGTAQRRSGAGRKAGSAHDVPARRPDGGAVGRSAHARPARWPTTPRHGRRVTRATARAGWRKLQRPARMPSCWSTRRAAARCSPSDRFGVEPVCQRRRNAGIRQLRRRAARATPPTRDAIDHQAIYDYVYFHMVPAPRTIYRASAPAAGHFLLAPRRRRDPRATGGCTSRRTAAPSPS